MIIALEPLNASISGRFFILVAMRPGRYSNSIIPNSPCQRINPKNLVILRPIKGEPKQMALFRAVDVLIVIETACVL